MKTGFSELKSVPILKWMGMFVLSIIAALAMYAILRSTIVKFPSKEIFGALLSLIFLVTSAKMLGDLGIGLRQTLSGSETRVSTSIKTAVKYYALLFGVIVVTIGVLAGTDYLLSHFNILQKDALDKLIPESLPQTSYIATSLLGSPWRLVLFMFSACVLGPIGEELMFRRLFYVGLRHKYSFIASLALSSLFFGFFHGGGWFVASINGSILGYVYEKEKDLLAVIFLHSIINITAIAAGFTLLS
ncbi:MAG TPA: hypothetical protein DCS63_06980 [Elusimicrobia bacterium]|nr:hypothetical protein [Elusimicrobiota bacterium]